MAKIKCHISLTQKDWRYVYSSVLNFFNQEIQSAYTHAITFYEANKELSFVDTQIAFTDYVKEHNFNEYQFALLKSALFSGTNSKLYKPKKNNFKMLNNRSKHLSTETFSISFNKNSKQIAFLTSSFDDFDKFIASNKFIAEFINMTNTINWPTRPGPNKTVKGCIMAVIENNTGKIFYKVGPNPPTFENNYTDITIDEPNVLKSDMIRNIKLVSNTPEETAQPIPVVEDLTEF